MSDDLIDRARPVREGESLDTAALEGFLGSRIDGFRAPVTVEQFPGGHSNLTYLLRDANEHEYVLRRPPRGAETIQAGHDVLREHRLLVALNPVLPQAPRPLAAAAADETTLGVPFFVMERMRGLILRGGSPLSAQLSPDTRRALSEAFVAQLAALHALDWRAAGLGDIGHPEGYVARQVAGWTRRYEKARTDDLPELEQVMRWLAANVPAESTPTLIHNDFKLDNLVLDPAEPTRILAVLDWEMATVGDPLSDLGMALAYWLEPGDPAPLLAMQIGPTHLPGHLTRAELVERYAQRTGRDVSKIVFFHVLGLFKVAVIAQQIYARYHRGLTKDERFGRLRGAVRLLSRFASGVIEAG